MSHSVRLSGIHKSFGSVKALDDVSLNVRSGSIHAIVGENGAGKTTLMRVLYGAVPPESGTIEVDGSERDWQSTSEAISHGVGMVSQHYSIVPELTCLQNILLGSDMPAWIPVAASRARAEQ